MSNLLDLYRKHCKYEITDYVQQLDVSIDIDRLRKEVFSLVIKNNFGYNAVSLRMPEDELQWVSTSESLEANAVNDFRYDMTQAVGPLNQRHNKEYTVWHPDLEGSYLQSLVPVIEEYTGLKMGRIRLGWLMPHNGYKMHADLDPMRLHIPILTNKLAYIIHDGLLHHMEYGKLSHLVSSETHTARNFGMLPRLHLVFSTYGNEEIDNALSSVVTEEATRKNFIDHIVHEGIDEYTINQLYRINEGIATSPEAKAEVARDAVLLKKIIKEAENASK